MCKKNLVYLICGIVLSSALLLSCDRLEDILNFSISDQTSFSIPATTPGVLPVLSTPDVKTNSQQEYASQGTEAKYVKTAYLTELKLTITSPEDKRFTFLKSIKLFISAEGADEALLASKDNIDNSVGNTLDLEPQANLNLKPYISGETYQIRVEAVTDENINSKIDITSDMEFDVTADVF